MPLYRIRHELMTGRQTAGYQGSNSWEIHPTAAEAWVVDLEPRRALEWLATIRLGFEHAWEHYEPELGCLMTSFQHEHCWKGHRLDQIRAVLERIEPDGRITVEGVSAAWSRAEAKTPRPHLARRTEFSSAIRHDHPVASTFYSRFQD